MEAGGPWGAAGGKASGVSPRAVHARRSCSTHSRKRAVGAVLRMASAVVVSCSISQACSIEAVATSNVLNANISTQQDDSWAKKEVDLRSAILLCGDMDSNSLSAKSPAVQQKLGFRSVLNWMYENNIENTCSNIDIPIKCNNDVFLSRPDLFTGLSGNIC